MATTTNFGWETPDDTDLVKNGAAAMRTLGNAIDTSMADLKGGTSGQVLKKNSNTDMDFIWSSDATGMTNPMTTTGDTIYSSSGSTPARLAIGTTGQILTVSGGLPVWATPAGGGKILQVVMGTYSVQTTTTSSSYSDTGLTATITPTSSSSKVLVLVAQNGCRKINNNTGLNLQLLRNSTTLSVFAYRAGWNSSTTDNAIGSCNAAYLDSPATTSPVTYKTQQSSDQNSNRTDTQTDGQCTSTIILMEVGA